MSSPQRKRPRVRSRLGQTKQQTVRTVDPMETRRDDVIVTEETEPVDQLSDESLQNLLNSIVAEHNLSGSSGLTERVARQRKRPFDLSTILEEPSLADTVDEGEGDIAPPLGLSSSSIESSPLVEAVEILSPQRSFRRRTRHFRPSELLSSNVTSSSDSSLDKGSPTCPVDLQLYGSNNELSMTKQSSELSPSTRGEQHSCGAVSNIFTPGSRQSPRASLSPPDENFPSDEHPASARGSGDSSEGTSSLVNFLLDFPSEKTVASREKQLSTSSAESQDLSLTPLEGSYFQPPPSILRETFNVFLIRKGVNIHSEPKKSHVTAVPRQRISVAGIDPMLVGPNVVQTVLRVDQRLRKGDGMEVMKTRQRCMCDVPKHPRHWSRELINDVHSYSFLLLTQDLSIEKERIIEWNELVPGLMLYNVRMREGDSWKRKAEQVLKYIDVELGIGDQTVYQALHYIQPLDRMIVLILMKDRVIGLVVAEKLDKAYKVLLETRTCRELDWKSAVDVRVGINQLWVHVSLRRNKLATQLCQVVREQFFPHEALRVEDLAFNNVSETGIKFAKYFANTRHNGNKKVLLYLGKVGRRF